MRGFVSLRGDKSKGGEERYLLLHSFSPWLLAKPFGYVALEGMVSKRKTK